MVRGNMSFTRRNITFGVKKYLMFYPGHRIAKSLRGTGPWVSVGLDPFPSPVYNLRQVTISLHLNISPEGELVDLRSKYSGPQHG